MENLNMKMIKKTEDDYQEFIFRDANIRLIFDKGASILKF